MTLAKRRLQILICFYEMFYRNVLQLNKTSEKRVIRQIMIFHYTSQLILSKPQSETIPL